MYTSSSDGAIGRTFVAPMPGAVSEENRSSRYRAVFEPDVQPIAEDLRVESQGLQPGLRGRGSETMTSRSVPGRLARSASGASSASRRPS